MEIHASPNRVLPFNSLEEQDATIVDRWNLPLKPISNTPICDTAKEMEIHASPNRVLPFNSLEEQGATIVDRWNIPLSYL